MVRAFDTSWSVLKNDIPAITTVGGPSGQTAGPITAAADSLASAARPAYDANEIPREYYDKVVTFLQSRIEMLEDQVSLLQRELNSPFYQKPTKEQILSQYDQTNPDQYDQ